METVKERIQLYTKCKGISLRAFCASINVSPAYVSCMRKSIAPDKIASIVNHYPDLNIAWLMTGEGSMIKEDKAETIVNQNGNQIVGNGSSIGSNNQEVEHLKEIIKQKDEIIALLKEQIEILKSR